MQTGPAVIVRQSAFSSVARMQSGLITSGSITPDDIRATGLAMTQLLGHLADDPGGQALALQREGVVVKHRGRHHLFCGVLVLREEI